MKVLNSQTTHLTTVLSKVDLASLWNVMITLVAGNFSALYILSLHLLNKNLINF